MKLWTRKTRLLVSPSTYDELAGMVAADDYGELDLSAVVLVRGEEPLKDTDPLAAHRARVLSAKAAPK
jgi:hypothetical protein